MAQISQNFEATQGGVRTMRTAVQDSSAEVQQCLRRLSEMNWSGPARQAFDQVALDWYAAMMSQINVLGEYADTTEQIVNQQQRAEEERTAQAAATGPELPSGN
ncbi:WXG100 family type VII secretion target [Streptomyces sp. NPDC048629]|uniref:WXG100 family type VII secretion target n=1 Tax=Streptomyces sp. NPDC048629 TaxID=3154824 RepID=UPI00343A3E3D